MAQVKTRKISNAAVHINGTPILGSPAEVTVPDVKPITMDQRGLGQVGTSELPTGIEKMEGSIKFNSIDSDIVGFFGDFYKPFNLMVRTNIDKFTGSSLTEQIPAVYKMTVMSKGLPGSTFKATEGAEFSADFSVQAITYEEDGVELFHFDAINTVHRVNGVDVLAKFRANLGT